MMYAFFMSLEKPAGSHTKNTSRIWRSRNHNVRVNLNENKLTNVPRDIMYKKRLTDFEHREIKEKGIADVKDIDSENVGIRDEDVDDRDEGVGGVSCTDADPRVARTRYNDQRKNVNHTGVLDDIRIAKGSEDEFDLVGEGNHVSYDTLGNNTIASHLSVNENSKTNKNSKKRKSDWTGKQNNDVEYTSFRNEIIETIEKTEAMSMRKT